MGMQDRYNSGARPHSLQFRWIRLRTRIAGLPADFAADLPDKPRFFNQTCEDFSSLDPGRTSTIYKYFSTCD